MQTGKRDEMGKNHANASQRTMPEGARAGGESLRGARVDSPRQ